MEKLNQDFADIFTATTAAAEAPINSFKLNKNKKKKYSVLDNIPSQQQQVNPANDVGDRMLDVEKKQDYDSIVVPQTLQELQHNEIIEQVKAKTEKEEIKATVKLSKSHILKKPAAVKAEENLKEIQRVQQLTGNNSIPENLDIIGIEEDIAEINAATGEDFSIEDFNIKVVEKKSKAGYKKSVVNIRKDGIPKFVNTLSSNILKLSKNVISPRLVDVRVIANTNKTQLKSSTLKLSANCVVYKPDTKVLKVKKYQRIMISVPADYDSTGNLVIYMQEGRDKFIFELNRSEFKSDELFGDFICDCIAQYYVNGFAFTKRKMTLRSVNNPLMQVIADILRTGEYKALPYQDDNGKIYMVDFVSKGTKNQWLTVRIQEAQLQGTYEVRLINNVDASWERIVSSKTPITIKVLIEKLYQVLTNAYSYTYTDVESSEEDKRYYMEAKLQYKFLRAAFEELCELENSTDIGLQIKGTLSRKDTAAASKKDYNAEAIVGKTSYLDYFILSYSAVPIIGGDKRKGADYIDNQEYYAKYGVNDRSQYAKRKNTILTKEGAERNYNSRPLIFQLEYKVNNQPFKAQGKTFAEIAEKTGFLTENPTPPKA